MAIYVLDDRRTAVTIGANGALAAKAVRVLGYDSAAELIGAELDTANAGKIVCEAHSVAFDAKLENMKSMNAEGVWS